MTKPLVIISVPAGEFVHTRFMESLIALQGFTVMMGDRLVPGGLVVGVNVVHGSILQISRTSLVEAAIQGNATHVLFMDSVTAETPILVRRCGGTWIDIIEVSELIPQSERFKRKRTYRACQYEVLTHQGWQKPKAVMQARTRKPILRVSDERGMVSVTEDHSLFSGGSAIAGRDVKRGTRLDHLEVSDVQIPDNKIPPMTPEYAEILGFFAAEGTAGKATKNGWFWNLSNTNRSTLERYRKTLESTHARRFLFVEDKKAGYAPVWRLHATYPSELVPHYVAMMYTGGGRKRVPAEILNAPLDTVRAFIRGYEIGDGYETKNGTQNLTTDSPVLAAGLSLLYARVGRDLGVVRQRGDKPWIVNLFERKHGLEEIKFPPGVRHVARDEGFNGWVYDLCTEAGSFVGGVGLFVLHNSDMTFPHDTLIRLLKHDKDIVGANYPTKSVPAKPTSEALDHTPLHTREHDTGLVEAFYVATGCMLVKTEVFARLPTPWFQTPFSPAHNSFMTEDVYFCAKARDIGIEVWCDQDLSKEVAHIGAHFYRMSDVPGWLGGADTVVHSDGSFAGERPLTMGLDLGGDT